MPLGYPRISDGRTTGVGDLCLGGRLNVSSQARQQPVAFAIRGVLKAPTASGNDGLGTGRTGVLLDAVVSREVGDRVEVAGFGGVVFRSAPGSLHLPMASGTASGPRSPRARWPGSPPNSPARRTSTNRGIQPRTG